MLVLIQEAAFQSFVSEYGKSYASDPEELSRRLEIFRDNVRTVEDINSRPGQTYACMHAPHTHTVTAFVDGMAMCVCVCVAVSGGRLASTSMRI